MLLHNSTFLSGNQIHISVTYIIQMTALEETPKDAMDVLEELMSKRKWKKTMPSSKRSSTRGHSNVRDGKGRKDLL